MSRTHPQPSDLPPEPTAGLSDLVAALTQAAAALTAAARAISQVKPCEPATPSSSVTLTDAINDFLVAKATAGRSDPYLRQVRHHLCAFAAGRASVPLDQVTVADVERWVGPGRLSARTRFGRIKYLRTLFAWSMRRQLVRTNPAASVELPTLSHDAPGIHTPDQVHTLLEAARARSLDLTRTLALRYFAGLRAAEIARLDEADIGPRWVTVPAAKAKTRSRRLVTIHPALRAWLDLGGTLPGRTMEQQLWELTRAIGMPWPRNAARHSWCSYHLAAFASASQTALEAGHSETMLFRHYRELVTPEDATRFWAIRPK